MFEEIKALADRVPAGRASFVILTGSAVDRSGPAGDIDLVVVLRDEVPLEEAVDLRVAFSAEYARLHRRFDRHPDLEWPGEVLFARDLRTARRGAAFRRDPSGVILPGPLDEPWRYWISMVASGTAVRGAAEHAEQAAGCAAALVRQQLSRILPYGGTVRLDRFLALPGWWEEWRLPTAGSPRGEAVRTRLVRALARIAAAGEIALAGERVTLPGPTVRGWGERLEPGPAAPPDLDAYHVQYCFAAAQAYGSHPSGVDHP
ncbi:MULTISPECIES: hypothetical protein [Kitasatospora]|uniref:Uncharacterized protein n=1 Tax=Kitasatospora setae (strain ATCC 33774 / DSM 43861 / JCM 3304 / KCC A-0304 / NBRC 14216 / KM-6054) TaxID=452652 RepID=E4ND68_KITSK|nr:MULTISPECIES: hypothetical protein [Kitasatospora]BAJ29149.1 hypothetical protein KSE_33390 [Kitasatospora setae KM-6054]